MFNKDTVKLQVIALLNLSVRDGSGAASYTTDLGDLSYSSGEIDRAIQSALTEIMNAICETPGHPARALFETETALTNGSVIPPHIGPVGVPRIIAFDGDCPSRVGKRDSIENIVNYRSNPNHIYSETAHNLPYNGFPSKLACRYAIDEAANIVFYTGLSATSQLANFVEADYTKIPDRFYPLAINQSIANLVKDGDSSDIFSVYAQKAQEGFAEIRAQAADQPSSAKTVGHRDSGDK